MRAVFLLVLLALAASWRPTPDTLRNIVGEEAYSNWQKTHNPGRLYGPIVKGLSYLAQSLDIPEVGNTDYPYFGFIPPYVHSIKPGESWTYNAPCYKKTVFTLDKIIVNQTESINLTISASIPSSLGCADTYLYGSIAEVRVGEYNEIHTTDSIKWDVSGLSSSELWDIQTNGVRIFQFIENLSGLAYDINATIALFEPLGDSVVDQTHAEINVQFLADYAHHIYSPRAIQEVQLDESMIQNGDFLGVIRLDGLDPMLSWAMGSVTGHTTVALRDPNGVLHVCESTIESAYWPTDGIQCTPYTDWLQLAKAANYQVTHAPLSPNNAKLFDNTAAWNYFKTVEGYEYGFYNQFWGWIDTNSSNYPCLPPDWKTCLEWQHIEIITGLLQNLEPDMAQKFFGQSLNIRLGTSGLTIPQIYQTAAQRGISVEDLYTSVELDSYVYNTTRYGVPTPGPSMVCCVFVCEVWKNGGIFGNISDQINCGEFTNWDDYGMHVFNDNYQKPTQCQTADPQNPTCQLEGAYTLVFNDYNQKSMAPHMAEDCPSQNPDYYHPPTC